MRGHDLHPTTISPVGECEPHLPRARPPRICPSPTNSAGPSGVVEHAQDPIRVTSALQTEAPSGVQMQTSHPIVDAVLEQHRRELGGALPMYRNHVLRCLNYQQLLLGEPVPDAVALAWAVHDLGIWTAGTLDYLEPSANLITTHAAEFALQDTDQAHQMILDHHRLRGIDDRLCETFRIADRIDVSHGLLHRPLTRPDVKSVVAQLPYLAFHPFLARHMTTYALTHPTRPLPMIRW